MGAATKTKAEPLYARMQEFNNTLRAPFEERDEEAYLLTLCLTAEEHMAQIGEAGTAKSMLAERATKLIDGARIFDLQFFKGTVPEEVFGPFDPKALIDQGVFSRRVEGQLPDCEIAFLDEWWKANSMILNGTLRVMLERKYKNGGQVLDVPLITGLIASNELPERSQVELMAIRDRILVTKIVQRVRASDSFRRMLDGHIHRTSAGDPDPQPVVTLDELRTAIEQVRQVTVTPETRQAIEKCWKDCDDNQLHVSDRRMLKSVKLGMAKAWLSGRKEMLPEDLTVFQHTLWIDPDDQAKAHAVTLNFASEFDRKAARFRQEFEDQLPALNEVRDMLSQDPIDFNAVTPKAAKANMVLKGLSEKVKEQQERAEADNRDTRTLDDLGTEIQEARRFIRTQALSMDT